jgi:D-alanyl-D-alanine carboxypeptidase (penicillin-binding protein 5/6)
VRRCRAWWSGQPGVCLAASTSCRFPEPPRAATETSTYSTPSDLLTLGLAAMRNPVFRSIVDQRFYQLPKGPGHHGYWWDNTNGLIGSYQGAAGIKTGYTDGAGHCLLFEAIRNGRTLIGPCWAPPRPARRPAPRMPPAC